MLVTSPVSVSKPPEKLDPGITSGMLLGEFPLPSYLKVRLSMVTITWR